MIKAREHLDSLKNTLRRTVELLNDETESEDEGVIWKRSESLRRRENIIHASVHLGFYLYDPTECMSPLHEHIGSTLCLRIPHQYLSLSNVNVKRRLFWGTDYYTDDSDICAMALHAGCDQGKDICMEIRVYDAMDCYTSSNRCGIKSRRWTGPSMASICIESIDYLKVGQARQHGRKQHKTRMSQEYRIRDRCFAGHHIRDPNKESRVNLTTCWSLNGDPCIKYDFEIVKRQLTTEWFASNILYLETAASIFSFSLVDAVTMHFDMHFANANLKPILLYQRIHWNEFEFVIGGVRVRRQHSLDSPPPSPQRVQEECVYQAQLQLIRQENIEDANRVFRMVPSSCIGIAMCDSVEPTSSRGKRRASLMVETGRLLRSRSNSVPCLGDGGIAVLFRVKKFYWRFSKTSEQS